MVTLADAPVGGWEMPYKTYNIAKILQKRSFQPSVGGDSGDVSLFVLEIVTLPPKATSC